MTATGFKIGDRLKHLRTEAGLSKGELARMIGTSDVSVGYWERGISKTIRHDLLMRLALALNVTVSELVEDPLLTTHNADLLTRHAEALDRMASETSGEEYSALRRAADYLREEAQSTLGTTR